MATTAVELGKPPYADMVWIPGGTFLMGSDHHYSEEAPTHQVTIEGFWIDKYTVTNDQFRRFVKETGHVTLSERVPKATDYPGAKPEMLVPASVVFQKPPQRVDLGNHYNWWSYVPGANWRHPEGPASSLKGRARHPVVHVAFEDAEACPEHSRRGLHPGYCKRNSGKREQTTVILPYRSYFQAITFCQLGRAERRW
jgi:formylglycine-generating enzyme